MSEKLKVQDLPKEEQEKLIAEAQKYGIKGLVVTWNVETLKAKIQAAKEKQNGEQENAEDEQKTENGEQNGEENEQNAEEDEQNGEKDEQENGELPDGLNDEAKAFLNGETDELPNDAEEISEEEAKAKAPKKQKAKEEPKAKEYKICHICRSKVIDGVCTGCGFTLSK